MSAYNRTTMNYMKELCISKVAVMGNLYWQKLAWVIIYTALKIPEDISTTAEKKKLATLECFSPNAAAGRLSTQQREGWNLLLIQ